MRVSIWSRMSREYQQQAWINILSILLGRSGQHGSGGPLTNGCGCRADIPYRNEQSLYEPRTGHLAPLTKFFRLFHVHLYNLSVAFADGGRVQVLSAYPQARGMTCFPLARSLAPHLPNRATTI